MSMLGGILKLQTWVTILQSLHIHNIFMQHSALEFASIMTIFPTVTHLSLVDGDVNDALDALATYISSRNILLPELSSMALESMDEDCSSWNSPCNLISHCVTHQWPINQLPLASFGTVPTKQLARLCQQFKLELEVCSLGWSQVMIVACFIGGVLISFLPQEPWLPW